MSVHRRALRSSIVKKALVAVTGLVLIGFLLLHMFGNLKIFAGADAYNYYANWLKEDILYPILPHGAGIWVIRVVVFVSLVVHVWLTILLWRGAVHARGSNYAVTNRKQSTFAVKWQRWGGITLGLLLVFHILMFTTGTIHPGFTYDVHDPFDMFVGAFSTWWVVVVYIIFMALVALHVRHGFWSAMATLGVNVSKGAYITLNIIAYIIAAIIILGFVIPPLAVAFGIVR